jgi:hypothetical protein
MLPNPDNPQEAENGIVKMDPKEEARLRGEIKTKQRELNDTTSDMDRFEALAKDGSLTDAARTTAKASASQCRTRVNRLSADIAHLRAKLPPHSGRA